MKTAGHRPRTSALNALALFALIILNMAVIPPTSAAEQPAPMTITDEMSCGVCGMFPAKFVKWQTQIIFSDGTMVPFDGSKDMFKYILDMAQYDPKHSADDIAAIWVKVFDTGLWINGREATFVVGSKVMGPMGRELIPFKNSAEAENFKKSNGGMIKVFDDISMDDIKGLGMSGMKTEGKMPGKM